MSISPEVMIDIANTKLSQRLVSDEDIAKHEANPEVSPDGDLVNNTPQPNLNKVVVVDPNDPRNSNEPINGKPKASLMNNVNKLKELKTLDHVGYDPTVPIRFEANANPFTIKDALDRLTTIESLAPNYFPATKYDDVTGYYYSAGEIAAYHGGKVVARYNTVIRANNLEIVEKINRFQDPHLDHGIRGQARYGKVTKMIEKYLNIKYPELNITITAGNQKGPLKFYVWATVCKRVDLFNPEITKMERLHHLLMIDHLFRHISQIDIYSKSIHEVTGIKLH